MALFAHLLLLKQKLFQSIVQKKALMLTSGLSLNNQPNFKL